MHKTTESASFSASCRIEGKTPFIESCEKDYERNNVSMVFIAINSLPTSVLCKQFGPRSGPNLDPNH